MFIKTKLKKHLAEHFPFSLLSNVGTDFSARYLDILQYYVIFVCRSYSKHGKRAQYEFLRPYKFLTSKKVSFWLLKKRNVVM